MIEVDYIGEGPTDAAVARRLIRAAGGTPGTDFASPRRGRGKDQLDARIAGLNVLAGQGQPVLVLRDLDGDADCAAALAATLLSRPASCLCLRIAVLSVESWLLADRACFADALAVPVKKVTNEPEALARPKDHVIALARQSRNRRLARELVPDPRSGIVDGPLLGAWLSGFAEAHWDPRRAAAAGTCRSLAKALTRIEGVVRSK